jgi:ABC-2 type transport system permease protein
MNTTTPDALGSTFDSPSPSTAWSPLRCYTLEAKYELLKVARMPTFAIPSISFPIMFYVLFGLAFGGGRGAGGISMATYLIATYGAFGVIGASLFGFGVGVAVERGQGWMILKRATPMPPFAYFLAKLAVCTIFAAVIVAALSILGVAFGGVRLPATVWAQLWAILIAGAIPFCALGLALGNFVGPNSAPPIVNLVYLPMSFASGLWIPIQMLPPVVRAIGHALPPYHLGQLALGTIGAGQGEPAWTHVATLAGFTLLGLGLAWIGHNRDQERTWG